jgi:hypothetical protein
MANWVSSLSAQYPNTPVGKIVPIVATYSSVAAKTQWMRMPDLSDAQQAEYNAGTTKSGAAKEFRASGSVGLVTSSLSNAAQNAAGLNNWHTVGIARVGKKVYVHDPAYNAADHVAGISRMADVNRTRMVQALVGDWASVTEVYYQGPPNSYNRDQQECMGWSAQ